MGWDEDGVSVFTILNANMQLLLQYICEYFYFSLFICKVATNSLDGDRVMVFRVRRLSVCVVAEYSEVGQLLL